MEGIKYFYLQSRDLCLTDTNHNLSGDLYTTLPVISSAVSVTSSVDCVAYTAASAAYTVEMGIFPPKPRTPNQKPTTFPDAFVKSDVIRELTVDFRDHESLSRGKPHGIHGVEIRWAILDHQPQDVNELIHSEFDTHSPFTLEFKENERGQTVWFCLRWENTRGEKGPWSEFISAIIP
jgi:hypothetical protein